MADLGLWIIVGAFLVWEIFAHYADHNRTDHTLSNRIWALESRYGLPARLAVSCGLIALFLHLVLHLF